VRDSVGLEGEHSLAGGLDADAAAFCKFDAVGAEAGGGAAANCAHERAAPLMSKLESGHVRMALDKVGDFGIPEGNIVRMVIRPPEVYADHGVPIRDERQRKITRFWLRHHEAAFQNKSLRIPRPADDEQYGNRDLFADTTEACRRRGLKFYARILKTGSNELPGCDPKVEPKLEELTHRGMSAD